MDASLPLELPEIIFSSSDTTLSRKINRMEAEGKLRKLASKIYTPNMDEVNNVKKNLSWFKN
jgi:hypothetical protein